MEWYETEKQSRIFSAPVERHHIYLDPKKPQVICLDQRKPQAIYSDPESQKAYRVEVVITSVPERRQDISSDQDEDKVTSLDLGVGKKQVNQVLALLPTQHGDIIIFLVFCTVNDIYNIIIFRRKQFYKRQRSKH